MKFYVKAFYLDHSFKNGKVVGCVVYTDENQHKADRVRDHLRRRGGQAQGLYFTHDENGCGTTTLEAHHMSDYRCI
jgi:hypothetical protein